MEVRSYNIKLTDKTEISISPSQYEAFLTESATGKDGIVVCGQYIAFKAVYSITGSSKLPESERPAQTRQELPTITKSKHTEQWLEATKRNKERLMNGIKPIAHWRVTTDGKLIEDPEYYTNPAGVL